MLQVENHGVDVALMEKVKRLVYSHYDEHLKESFYNSELARGLGPQTNAGEVDWETTYFVQHQPVSNAEKFIHHGLEFKLRSFFLFLFFISIKNSCAAVVVVNRYGCHLQGSDG